MKSLITILAILITCSAAVGFFPAKALDQKVRESDLIAKGFVRKVTRMMPAEHNAGFDSKGDYSGPLSIAAVELEEVWKRPLSDTQFQPEKDGNAKLPKTIMVPCGYHWDPSPSSLTTGCSYIIFLRRIGPNIYHPVDPASTHRIKEGHVSDFGIDYDPEPDPKFGGRFMSVQDFKKEVDAFIPATRKPQ